MSEGVWEAMRDVFIEGIYEKMRGGNEDLFFLAADFGSPKLDALREDFPDRFINVGIAEQNLINVASGLALEGFTTFGYAIAPFISMRCFEQIRNNLSLLPQIRPMNVNLVGVGAGLSYDVSGPSHHCLEDISVIRTLPNISVISPSDWVMCEMLVDYALDNKCPKYFRFDGKPLPAIYTDEKPVLEKGFHMLSENNGGVCLVTTGFMTHTGIEAVRILRDKGINAGHMDLFVLKPDNSDEIFAALKGYSHVVTVEEAFTGKGGLDTLVATVLSDRGAGIRLLRLGFGDEHQFEMGGRAHLLKLNGLDADSIAAKAINVLAGN